MEQKDVFLRDVSGSTKPSAETKQSGTPASGAPRFKNQLQRAV